MAVDIPEGIDTIGHGAFCHCEEIATPAGVLPAEAVEAYKKDFYWREYNIKPME